MEDDDNEQGGPEEAEEKDDGKKGPKKKFEVKKWNAVALWAWDIVVDNCAICRNHIMDLCMLQARFPACCTYAHTVFVDRHSCGD
jgi:RING-box protein 1